MAKLAELKRYLNYEFSSGCYTGEDYKSFQTKYINYLKAMCRENHWQLVTITASPLSSKVRKTNAFTYPSATSGISATSGTAISSFARRKTKSITEAVSITIPPSTGWK